MASLAGIGLGASGIAQLLGGLFGSSSSGTTSGSSQTSSMSQEDLQNLLNTIQQLQSQQNTQQTTELQGPQQQLLNQVTSSLTPFNTQAYVGGQTQNIEATGNQQQAQIANELAARGLATSPVAATAQANVAQNTLNQVNQLQQQAPLVAQQANLANVAGATNLIAQAPKTIVGSTTGTQTGTTGQQGQTIGNSGTQGQGTFQGSSTQTQNGLLSNLFSDERLKDDIKPLPHEEALNKLMKLKPSSWKWKADGSSDSGVVAQDVEKVFPHAVGTDKGSGMKTVDMNALMPHIIASIQALKQGHTERG